MNRRYERNITALSVEENERLKDFKICVIGCGGLGGYIIEHLGRIGIGHITAVDGDVFEESNLNRQLLSDEPELGQSKAKAAEKRMSKVNSSIKVNAVYEYITEENSEKIISGHDIVIDALDNIPSRLIIEEAAQKLKIPLVHGAIAGWYGQVMVILPGSPIFSKIYSQNTNKGMETQLGNLPFTAAAVAAVQAAEAIKVLLGRSGVISGKLLTLDLLSQEYETFDI